MADEALQLEYVSGLDSIGVVKNLSPEQIPLPGFQDAINVRFREGKVSVAPGWTQFITGVLDSKVMYSDQFFKTDGSDFLLLFSKTQGYLYDPNNLVVNPIAGIAFTGSDDQFFDSDLGFNTFLVTNGKDLIQKWIGPAGASFAALGGLTNVEPNGSQMTPVAVNSANIIRLFANFVVLLNTTENGVPFPTRVRWGQYGFLENFKNNSDGTGQAGSNDINETSDFLMNADHLSNSLVIFKERSIYLMTYIGTPAIFQFRRVISGVGLYAQRAFANLGDEIVFLGNDNFYDFNGYTINPVASDRIKNFFFQDLNPQFSKRVIAFIVEEEDEVQFWYPSVASISGEIDKAIIFNYVTRTWTFRSAPSNGLSAWFYYFVFANYTWATFPNIPWNQATGVWADKQRLANAPLNLFGDQSGALYQYGTAYAQNGLAYTKNAITRDHDLGRPSRNKRVERIDVGAAQGVSTTLNVYVGHRPSIGAPIVYAGPYTVSLVNGSKAYVLVDITDVYFVLKFETTGTGDAWDLLNYGIWYTEKELRK